MKTPNLKVLALIGGSLLAAATLHANLVLDPGFDDQIQPTDSINPTSSPWTRNPDQGIIVAGGGITGGAAYFSPSGDSPSDLLTQTLATTDGTTYSISFWLKDGGSANTFTVLWGGVTISTLGPPVVTTDGNWEQFTLDATATGTSTVLGFEATPGLSTYTPILDNVDVEASVAPVPEPSTYISGALLLIPFGLGALRGLNKKRGE